MRINTRGGIRTLGMLFAMCVLAVINASAKDVYATDLADDKVMVFDGRSFAYKGLFIVPGGGYLANPFSVAVSASGDLYVAGWGSGEIRRYTSSGSLTGIFVARGTGGLRRPTGMAFGTDGNLYVADDNTRIMRFDAATGAARGLAGDTADATFIEPNSSWSVPYDLAFGPDGDLYICSWNARVVRYGLDGTFKGVFANSVTGDLVGWAGLAFNPANGDLYVADRSLNRILVFGAPSSASPGARLHVYSPTGLLNPQRLAFLSSGLLAVTSAGNNTIKLYSSTGTLSGNLPGTVASPKGIVQGSNGDVFVASWSSNQVYRYASTNSTPAPFLPGEGRSGGLDGPVDIVFRDGGNAFVSSYGSGDVKEYSRSSGQYLRTFVSRGSGGLLRPQGLEFGFDGNLYVADSGTNAIRVYDGSSGAPRRTISLAGLCSGWPRFMARTDDLFGTRGTRLFVTCSPNVIVRIDTAGSGAVEAEHVAGPGSSSSGKSCALRDSGGIQVEPYTPLFIFVVDRLDNGVKRYGEGTYSCPRTNTYLEMNFFNFSTPPLDGKPEDVLRVETGSPFEELLVSVPESRVVKHYLGLSIAYIGLDTDEMVMPYGLASGPAYLGPRNRFQSFWGFAKRQVGWSLYFLRWTFDDPQAPDRASRKYWDTRVENGAAARRDDRVSLAAMLRSMPEEAFEFAKAKMRLFSSLDRGRVRGGKQTAGPKVKQ